MAKKIVFCADGTWDNTGKNTNVYRLYKALTTTSDQAPYYDDGVGADGNPIEKLLGGAFGAGLFQKIKDGYTKIAHVYEQGDETFLFGFSRGAYTARSLAGMIAVVGLPTANFDDKMVDLAFEAYRNKQDRAALLAQLNAEYAIFDAKLSMVGVWDTVGSLGIPSLLGGVDPLLYGFLDTGLHPDVLHAYQALAVNERRCEFPPALWTGTPAPHQTVEQVWFSGVHCDVGGSYPLDANGSCLADIPLAWMMSKAAGLGLRFAPGTAKMYTLPLAPEIALDTIHESWNPLWAVPVDRTVPKDAMISDSLEVRCLNIDSYRPCNIELTAAGELAPNYTRVYLVDTPAAVAGA